MTIKLIAGLGNIGTDNFIDTRHNFGAKYVNLLAKQYKVTLNKSNILSGYIGHLKLQNNIVHLLIPNLYMNNNGLAISRCVDLYQLQTQEILVVHDDLTLSPGVIRLKLGNKIYDSHHGVYDVVIKLNNKFNFYRLRIGIGHPGDKSKVINFVLSTPSIFDQNRINEAIYRAILCTTDIVFKKFVKVMNSLHRNK